jgi:hypothetical protein
MVWADEPDKLYHCLGSTALVVASFAALRPPLLGPRTRVRLRALLAATAAAAVGE